MSEGRPCPYGDPSCPCQDGDPCHYEPDGGTPALSTVLAGPAVGERTLGVRRMVETRAPSRQVVVHHDPRDEDAAVG